MVSRIPIDAETAALLTRMSTRPNSLTAASTMASYDVGSRRSATTTVASPQAVSIRFCVSFARSSNTSTRTTRAPSAAKRTEMAFPVPTPGPLEPAPVTMATMPSSRLDPSVTKTPRCGGTLPLPASAP